MHKAEPSYASIDGCHQDDRVQEPPVYVERQAPPQSYWYYCPSTKAYSRAFSLAVRRGSRSRLGRRP